LPSSSYFSLLLLLATLETWRGLTSLQQLVKVLPVDSIVLHASVVTSNQSCSCYGFGLNNTSNVIFAACVLAYKSLSYILATTSFINPIDFLLLGFRDSSLHGFFVLYWVIL